MIVRALVLVALLAAKKEDPATVEAKTIYKRGEVAFKLGRFDDALVEFSKAYETKPMSAFLFNIAQCHFNLKNYERAVFFFEGYLRDASNVAQAQTAGERLKEARAALAEQKAASERKEKERIDRERADRERAEREALARANAPRVISSAPVAVTNPPVATQTESAGPPVYEKWWFWTIIGGVVVAGAAAGVGAYFAVQPPPQVDPRGSLGTKTW